MTLYIIYIIKSKKIEVFFFIRILLILGIILGTIGTLQYFKIDIFRMEWFKKIIFNSVGENANINFEASEGRVYLTVYNPNYVGVIMSILIIIAINTIILSGNKINKVLSFIALPLMLISMFGSYSRSGMLGVVLGLIVITLVNIKRIWKYKYIFVFLLIIIIGITLAVNNKTDDKIKNRFLSIFKMEKIPYNNLMNIETTQDRIIITYNENKYSLLMFERSPIGLVLEDKKNILPKFKDGAYHFEIGDMENIFISVGKYNGSDFWQFKIDRKKWNFASTENGIKYINGVGKFTTTEMKPYAKIFEGYENIGSDRIYIWSRSIPLIKDRIFIGYGPDLYAIAFPQDDYIYKAKFLYYKNMIVDKPHNMYLQYLVNFGFPVFLAYMYILINIIYINLKKKNENLYIRSIVISSIAVIIVVSFFNDSTVSTSPLMWSLIGLGYSEV
ncbi:O-antigen ligase family protein, partial [Clostridiaceae bacterium HSG29]|nr:O-antigen ligase family protein [Clostridiaceae bacterium HSG29]